MVQAATGRSAGPAPLWLVPGEAPGPGEPRWWGAAVQHASPVHPAGGAPPRGVVRWQHTADVPSPPLPCPRPLAPTARSSPASRGRPTVPRPPAGAAGTFSQVTCAVVLPSLPTNSDVPVSPWQREVAWDAHTMSGGAGRHRAGHSQEPPGDSGLCRVLPDATGSRARDTGTGEGCHDLLPSARARLQVGGRRQLASPLGGCFQPSPYGQTPAVPPGSGEGSPR